MKIVTSSTLQSPSPPPVLSSVPPSPTRTTLLVSLPPCTPFHSSWYSPVSDHSWHSSPPIPSCLYSLLHFSSALSITLYSWAQVFEILHFRHIFSLHVLCVVILPLSPFVILFNSTTNSCHVRCQSYSANISNKQIGCNRNNRIWVKLPRTLNVILWASSVDKQQQRPNVCENNWIRGMHGWRELIGGRWVIWGRGPVCVIFFYACSEQRQFSTVWFGGFVYGLVLGFWVVFVITVTLNLTVTLITNLTVILP